MHNPSETLNQGLLLAFKPVNMDVLPLNILLMVFFPPVLWAMLRRPNLTLEMRPGPRWLLSPQRRAARSGCFALAPAPRRPSKRSPVFATCGLQMFGRALLD